MWGRVNEGKSCSDPIRERRESTRAEAPQQQQGHGSPISQHTQVSKLISFHFHINRRSHLKYTLASTLSFSVFRLSGVRSLAKPPSMAQLDKLNSNSLDTEVRDTLPPKIPPYSKLQELSGSAGNSTSSCLTPSPAPVLNVNSSACFSSSGIGLGPRQVTSLGVESNEGRTSPLLYPRMSGLHRSLESLPLQMSLAPEPQEREEYKGGENLTRGYTTLESRVKDRHDDSGQPSSWTPGSKVSLTPTDRSVQFYSNTIHNAAHTAYSAESIPGFK